MTGSIPRFPEGTICRERPPAMGVIREHPLRRKTTDFRGVAPGITGGAIGSGLFFPKVRSVQQTRGVLERRPGRGV